jgi:RNA polymerase sigma-70 factor (ECF subfamily)
MTKGVNELILDCLEGKRMAQKELYQLYAPKMLGICYRYTKTLEDAEDVLQEGFVKTFNNIKHYKGTGDFAAWLRTIMVNTAIDYLNKHKKYKKELQLLENDLNITSNETPEIYLDTKDLVELIRKLPIIYQLVFNLIAVEGYSQQDVAELMNTNINTIRSRYSRARTMLMEHIKQQEELQLNYYAK